MVTILKTILYWVLIHSQWLKKQKKCKQKTGENLNTANAARFLLSCTLNQKIDQLEKKLHYVYFQRGDMTIEEN